MVAITALATDSSAVDFKTSASKRSGSMRAMTWPDLTSVLKSTKSSDTCPEISEPTSTVTTGFSRPDAETDLVILPLSIFAVWNLFAGVPSPSKTKNAADRRRARPKSPIAM